MVTAVLALLMVFVTVAPSARLKISEFVCEPIVMALVAGKAPVVPPLPICKVPTLMEVAPL